MANRIPIVAIVGRPNVGKSTLFNRIVGSKVAVVEDREGVTRDRNYMLVDSYEFPFHLVDTGGMEVEADRELSKEVKQQAILAIEEADVVLALFDGDSVVHPDDLAIVKLLRRQTKPVIFAVNKCDGKEQVIKTAEYYSLGLDELFDVSALHGYGVASLMIEVLNALPDYDALVQSAESRREAIEQLAAQIESQPVLEIDYSDEDPMPDNQKKKKPPVKILDAEVDEEAGAREFPPVFSEDSEGVFSAGDYDKQYKLREFTPFGSQEDEEENDDGASEPEIAKIEEISVAIVGRPNVGKSTLLNLLAGEERAITSPISGTTRDSLDISITREGQRYTFVDTAGLRKKARISDKVERYATMRALSSISSSDVAVLLVDSVEGPSDQDAHILGLAHDQGRGVVIAVNKWDLVEKNHRTVKEFTDKIKRAFKFAQYAPIVFISALSGRRCPKLIEAIKEVAYSRNKRLPTRRLNKVIERAVATKSMPSYRGRRLKFFYITQVETCPPRFILFLNHPKGLHFSYLRYLKNSIRAEFEYGGTDIKISTRKRGEAPLYQ